MSKVSMGMLFFAAVSSAIIIANVLSAPRQAAFLGFDKFDDFKRTQMAAETVLESPEVDSGLDWNELIVSWDLLAAPGAHAVIAARAIYPDHATKYYVLGDWSPDDPERPRTSIKEQKDDDGNVLTDTLSLRVPSQKVQFQIRVKPGKNARVPELRFLGASFCNTKLPSQPDVPNKAAWGKQVDNVPLRCQGSYPGGGGWCSPTSLSMILTFWGQKLNREDLKKDVPEVAAGVFDNGFDGTGNWPFNSAYAGSFPGIRAYVTRFAGINELEDWIAAGIPVIVSGNLPLLEGKPLPPNDPGHIVVVVGFTVNGDPIFNDPGHRAVRQVYNRADFQKAWDNSHRTVYLIYPELQSLPSDRLGHWFVK